MGRKRASKVPVMLRMSMFGCKLTADKSDVVRFVEHQASLSAFRRGCKSGARMGFRPAKKSLTDDAQRSCSGRTVQLKEAYAKITLNDWGALHTASLCERKDLIRAVP